MSKQIQGSVFSYTILPNNFRLTAKTPDGCEIVKVSDKRYAYAFLYRTGIQSSATGSKWTIQAIGSKAIMTKMWERRLHQPNAEAKYALVKLQVESIKKESK